jgi:hypothetical protein
VQCPRYAKTAENGEKFLHRRSAGIAALDGLGSRINKRLFSARENASSEMPAAQRLALPVFARVF